MATSKSELFHKIDGIIKKAGFAFLSIGQDGNTPPFAYTVGITETYGCSELIIFGVGQNVADAVFNGLVEKIKSGKRFNDGDIVSELLNMPVAIKSLSKEVARPFFLNVSSRYKGTKHTPTFQQMVYPDRAGKFPWETGYDEGMRPIQLELWTATA
jgi:hypothetical protein